MPPTSDHHHQLSSITLLATVRSLAKAEGRQLQVLVDEALADLIEKRKQARPRAHVMAAYQGSA
ncbi:MAG: hypothetical protein DCO98_11735 [Altererythrobacter sp. XM-24bin4]|nr:MAG: hypothetical protein DCO81_06865 [Candidatus Aquiluna sp. XM-24bin5]PWL24021.1 MAG: hypothetical protein DCO98_11735 [Altererythrobacter sp. XM-24bin4]